jgi:hypothetical protein
VALRPHQVSPQFERAAIQQDFYGEPWGIDAPAAEQNLSRRIKTATAIQVEDPILLTLDDPRLFEYPWIYFVEPSSMRMPTASPDPPRVPAARRHRDDGRLSRPAEWDDFEREMKRCFPIARSSRCRRIIRSSAASTSWTAIRRSPGSARFWPGRTWERGGVMQHLRTILDDHGRPMVFINWNTDMGDGWEWSNALEYPGYIKYTAMAYRMGSTKSSTPSRIKELHGFVGCHRQR